jgi:hypothetical protein
VTVRKIASFDIRTLLLICAIAGVSSVGLGQSTQSGDTGKNSAPSLAGTEKWIEQTFGEGSHIVHKGFQGIGFDDSQGGDPCYVTFTVTEQLDPTKVRFYEFVSLADIDPTSIKVGDLIHDTDITTVKNPDLVNYSTYEVKDHPYVFVTVRTTDDNNKVTSHTKINGEDLSVKEHELGYSQEGIAVNPEYAQRFINALRHAVDLCGGKASTF